MRYNIIHRIKMRCFLHCEVELWSLNMKKSFLYYAYCGLFVLLSGGILKVSGASSKIYAFAHSLDIHGDEEAIKIEAERRMQEDARKREEERYWKEYREQQERENKEKEEKERKRIEEEIRRKEEENKAWEEYRRDLDRREQQK